MRTTKKVDLKQAADKFKKLFRLSEISEEVFRRDQDLIRKTEASCLKFGRQSAKERWKAGRLIIDEVEPHVGLKTWAREYDVPYESARKAKYLAERVSLEEIKEMTITEAYEHAKIVTPRSATGTSKNRKVVEPTTTDDDSGPEPLTPLQQALLEEINRRKVAALEEQEAEETASAINALRWSLDNAQQQLAQFLDLLKGCTLTADKRKEFACLLLDIRILADDALSAVKTDTALKLLPSFQPEMELPCRPNSLEKYFAWIAYGYFKLCQRRASTA